MLHHLLYGDDIPSAGYYGIEDAKVMIIDKANGTVEVDIDYLKTIEHGFMRWKSAEGAVENLKDENKKLEEMANLASEKKAKEIQALKDEIEKIKEETFYFDYDKETLKLMYIKAQLKALNLEAALESGRRSKPHIEYSKEYVEQEFNSNFKAMEKHLQKIIPSNYVQTLHEVVFLKNKIRRLEVDNKILKDKVGGIEVKNAERIKAGFSNVKKPQADPKLIIALLDQGLTKTEVAKSLKISRQTVYNALKTD